MMRRCGARQSVSVLSIMAAVRVCSDGPRCSLSARCGSAPDLLRFGSESLIEDRWCFTALLKTTLERCGGPVWLPWIPDCKLKTSPAGEVWSTGGAWPVSNSFSQKESVRGSDGGGSQVAVATR
ncbi:hypothetical protein SRHO_G00176880 [Serrasalmus rhombeus]